jgi:hypothetical protein
MNPIHEAGFASLVLLLFGSAFPALPSVLAAALGKRHPRVAAACAALAVVLASLLCVAAALTTRRFHEIIDHWVNAGAYGPPADVTRTYAPGWHDSARWPAIAGVLLSALPLALSAFGYRRARAGRPWGLAALVIAVVAGLSLGFCLVTCVA